MADLDALLGIEEEKQEEPQQQEAKKEEGAGARISIDASVLRQLAEAEAARAEKLGSAASSKEVQTRIADSIERIVEQVGAGTRDLASMPGRLSWRLASSAVHLRHQRAACGRCMARACCGYHRHQQLRAAVAAAAGEEAG
jgi:hypothetical protein